jgi:hypothetical protein
MQYNPQLRIPPVPTHDLQAQNGQSYVHGDPGPAIGELKTCNSTYGVIPTPSCTFIGTEGIARMTQTRGMEILRFEHAAYVLEQPTSITSSGTKSMWTFMDGHYRPLFTIEDDTFGPYAELAHAKYWVPKMMELMEQHGSIKVWGAPPRYVEIRKDGTVTVQQQGRVDTVPLKDIKSSFQAGDVVLACDAFYEARFIGADTPNASVLMLLVKILAGA